MTFTSFLKVFLYSSHAPFFEAVKPSSTLIRCNLSHGSISLAPSILWLAIPAATDLVCPPTFFFINQLSKILCLRSFTGEMFPHPTQIWFFSHLFPHSSPIRLLFHNMPPVHICQWFFAFCLQVFVETHLTQVGRICFSAFIHHYRRQLQTAENLFGALSVPASTRHFPTFLPLPGGAQVTPCSLFASSFPFWYIHKSCSFPADCKASFFVLSDSFISSMI